MDCHTQGRMLKLNPSNQRSSVEVQIEVKIQVNLNFADTLRNLSFEPQFSEFFFTDFVEVHEKKIEVFFLNLNKILRNLNRQNCNLNLNLNFSDI